MDTDNNKKEEVLLNKGTTHFILSHSYLTFLFAFMLGVTFDVFFPTKFFLDVTYQNLGVFMILTGTGLIYWATKASNTLKKDKKDNNVTTKSFENGPYKYLLNPTHFGLFIMNLGFGFIINSPFSIIFIVITHFVTKIVFLHKEEKILEKKYGQVYLNYRKKLNRWL